jgi:hypothetical protein
MHCAFATLMFDAVVNGVYDKSGRFNKAILNQNIPTKNYELELT